MKPVQRIEKYPNSNNFEIFSTMYVTFNLNNFIGKKRKYFQEAALVGFYWHGCFPAEALKFGANTISNGIIPNQSVPSFQFQ